MCCMYQKNKHQYAGRTEQSHSLYFVHLYVTLFAARLSAWNQYAHKLIFGNCIDLWKLNCLLTTNTSCLCAFIAFGIIRIQRSGNWAHRHCLSSTEWNASLRPGGRNVTFVNYKSRCKYSRLIELRTPLSTIGKNKTDLFVCFIQWHRFNQFLILIRPEHQIFTFPFVQNSINFIDVIFDQSGILISEITTLSE